MLGRLLWNDIKNHKLLSFFYGYFYGGFVTIYCTGGSFVCGTA